MANGESPGNLSQGPPEAMRIELSPETEIPPASQEVPAAVRTEGEQTRVESTPTAVKDAARAARGMV